MICPPYVKALIKDGRNLVTLLDNPNRKKPEKTIRVWQVEKRIYLGEELCVDVTLWNGPPNFSIPGVKILRKFVIDYGIKADGFVYFE